MIGIQRIDPEPDQPLHGGLDLADRGVRDPTAVLLTLRHERSRYPSGRAVGSH